MDHRDPETYSFDGYLDALGDDWYLDDPLLARWLDRASLDEEATALVRGFGRRAATTHRLAAEVVERAENLPRFWTRGPYNQTVNEVVVPAETRQMLGDVHGSGIWAEGLDERARYASIYLLDQNGEFGVTCSTACTDGMVRALRTLGDDDRSRSVLQQIDSATPESFIHGAQFVTEIQGGSDAATNQVRAEPVADGLYALSGRKWFCSNLTAEYWMTTARLEDGPADHRGVGLFCVPRRWHGGPNGYVVERLKDKLGTRALPTAEILLTGARGWPVGALDSGLKNMVAIVLTTSRIHNIVASGASARRAAREAHAYASFRQAFGRPLAEHPLISASLSCIAADADRMEAGAFGAVDAWVAAMESPADRRGTLWARVLVSISKAVQTRAICGQIYEAMMVFGGNGIEERFCALPRLWRDGAILETWEGPYTLLLMQALGDLEKYGAGEDVEGFLRHGLGDHTQEDHVRSLTAILESPQETESILAWGELAPRMVRAFQDKSLAELS
ncbi:MAG: acyl-CoA dehydrogenase family protein [Planctomycetota bacterium]|nr:acyl-CoA dehydrogenase family protein [Planctomycetota bacterium]